MMAQSFVEFEVEIGAPQGEQYPYTARGSGGDARGQFRLPTADAEFQSLRDRLARLDTDEASLKRIGTLLFEALFQGEAGRVYAASRSRLDDMQALTIRLSIPPELEEVAALPWEFMVDPDIGPLALFDTPIVRYLPQPTPLPTFPITLPLKVLLTGAQTPPPAEIATELAVVEAALRNLGDNVQIIVDPHLTADRLSEHLLNEVHIWHFVGHGRADDTGARLLFEDATGDADALDAAKLSTMLYRRVRLVILDACETGKIATDPFRSIAPALIRAQVPAVVAQQFQVPEAAARAFVTGFYRALARGFPLDACVTEGRKAVQRSTSTGQPDWGIPVVYSRVADGRLFELPAVQAIQPVAEMTTAASAPPAQSTPAGNAQAELREQIVAKRRERFLLARRATLYPITPAHLVERRTQLGAELQRLTAQLED
jgi:hypothetical protein